EDGRRGFHVTGVRTCALPICDAGHAASCENLATMALEGRGGQRDLIVAALALDLACVSDPGEGDACAERERLRRAGVIDTDDPTEMLDATVEACETSNVAMSCLDGGLLMLEQGQSTAMRGVELLERACELGEQQGCVAMAMLQIEGTNTVPENKATGLATLR